MENEVVTFTVTDIELEAAAEKLLDSPEYKADLELTESCEIFFARLKNDLKAVYELKHPEEYEEEDDAPVDSANSYEG